MHQIIKIEADLVALPEVHDFTDEEQLDEGNFELPVDIAGFVELQTQDWKGSSEDDDVPLAHLSSTPKKPKKETPEKMFGKFFFKLVKNPGHNQNLSIQE
ncbi:hypothetical protein JTB14_021150 [Gonioctena quinquepunctata]|nr:hypothetical protein JTB14_021150 [Gonioctena quinquepunctata]